MSLSEWCTSTLKKTFAYQPNAPPAYKYLAFLLHDWEAGTVENILPQEPFAFVIKQKGLDPDAPQWHTAMKSPEAEQWTQAAESELKELAVRKNLV